MCCTYVGHNTNEKLHSLREQRHAKQQFFKCTHKAHKQTKTEKFTQVSNLFKSFIHIKFKTFKFECSQQKKLKLKKYR